MYSKAPRISVVLYWQVGRQVISRAATAHDKVTFFSFIEENSVNAIYSDLLINVLK